MKELSRDEAAAIYRRFSWLRPRFDQVAKRAPRVATELFDTGANMGPAVAATFSSGRWPRSTAMARMIPIWFQTAASGR